MEEKYTKFCKTFHKKLKNDKNLILCSNSLSDGGVEMKVTVILIFFLISLNIFSEEYVCSVSYSGSDFLEVKTYERYGSIFRKTHKYGESFFQITKETEEFIRLNETYEYPSIYLVFLDKKNNKIVEEFTQFEVPDSYTRITGKCLIKK